MTSDGQIHYFVNAASLNIWHIASVLQVVKITSTPSEFANCLYRLCYSSNYVYTYSKFESQTDCHVHILVQVLLCNINIKNLKNVF